MHTSRRPSSASSISSTTSNPFTRLTTRFRLTRRQQSIAASDPNFSPPSSRRQSATCSGIPPSDLSNLWRCMLELQEEYGCYNSTRMDLAMESEDGMALMPSRFIIDTLNDSVFDLPEEGWAKLDQYLIKCPQ